MVLMLLKVSCKLPRILENEKLPLEDASYEAVLCVGCIAEGHIILKYGISEFIRLLKKGGIAVYTIACLLYTSPSPRDKRQSRMPSSA